MLTIPVVYDDATKRIAVSEEWAGTVIDDRSTMFSVSGIPSDAVSAKLDVKVSIKQSNGKTIRPFLILNGIESGTGTAVVPYELFYACKRDLKFIFQLEIMTEEETYASENWITMKVSPSITRRASQLPLWDQDKVLVDAYEVNNTKIVFRRFSGEEFSILLSDNPIEWENIQHVPWRTEWSTGTPKDKEILTESLVKGALDQKTDILLPIPRWDEETTYNRWSLVLYAHTVYESLFDDNKGHDVDDTEWWSPISGGSSPTPTGKGRYLCYIGNGTDTEYTINHDLGSKILLYNLIDISTREYVDAKISFVSPSEVKVSFNEPPGVNAIGAIFSTGVGGGGGGGDIESITTEEIDALFGA